MTGDVAHRVERPTWVCVACSEPWPCAAARAELAVTYAGDRVGLAMLLGGQLMQATAELPQVSVNELYGRFITWWRSPNTPERQAALDALHRRLSQ